MSAQCSFCGKGEGDVLCLTHARGAYICDKCTDMCAAIVAESRVKSAVDKAVAAALADHEPAKPTSFWAKVFRTPSARTPKQGAAV